MAFTMPIQQSTISNQQLKISNYRARLPPSALLRPGDIIPGSHDDRTLGLQIGEVTLR
jgi:hypothetical protein